MATTYNGVTLNTTGQLLRAGFSDFLNDGVFDGGTQTFHSALTNKVLLTIDKKYQKIVGSTVTVMTGGEQTTVDADPFNAIADFALPGGTFSDSVIIQGKLDIGAPGASGGLDVGEGGSYNAGAVAYLYDASAASGSRFTVIADLEATTALLGDVGDRIYFGVPRKFWGVRNEPTVAGVAGSMTGYYWNGALTQCDVMSILKDSANSIGDAAMEQIVQKEYVTFDHQINDDWALAPSGGSLDAIPNAGIALFWFAMQVTVAYSTPPTTVEIKVRGSDFDIISGTGFAVFWGQARVNILERISLDSRPGGGGSTQDLTIGSGLVIRTLAFDDTGKDFGIIYVLPEGVDTSSRLHFFIDYISEQAQDITLRIHIKKLVDNTAVGGGESTDMDVSTLFTVAAANTFYAKQPLTAASGLSIANLMPGDTLAIEVTITTASVGLSGSQEFLPQSLLVEYTRWTTGTHLQ